MASHFDRITIDPDICNGKPVVRGLRITVETILDHLSAGETRRRLYASNPCWSRRTSRRASPSPAA
jgi:uncharacterized protein (DUF433 family)